MYRGVLFFSFVKAEQNKSRRMRKLTENKVKAQDQLRSNRVSDQRLCFRYTDSTSSVSILSRSDIPSF